MLKIGILLGGKSIEREVSLSSGRTICDHLNTDYFMPIPIFQTTSGLLYILPWSFLYRGKISDFEHRLPKEAQSITWEELKHAIDFMYIATHGAYAEDGRLQAMLEWLQIPYLGTKLFGSSIAMHKKIHNDYLKNIVETPKHIYLTAYDVAHYDHTTITKCLDEASIPFPLIVKASGEGSSFGVFVVHSEQDLHEAVRSACYISSSKGQDVLIEEKLQGMEFTCIIITDEITGELIALPPTEILRPLKSEIFDYTQKYMPGAAHERTPPHCSKESLSLIQQTCIKAMKALHFSNLARIDGYLTNDNRVVIFDSNTLSGMGPTTFLFRQAAEVGIGHAQLINKLISSELKSYNMIKISKQKSITHKKKIAVVFGGQTHEKETSLNSGRNICYKLSSEKYDIIPLFLSSDLKLYILDTRLLVHTSTREITEHIEDAQETTWTALQKEIDFVFIGLHGGIGENGVLQGVLEMLEIPYNGSSIFTSSLCMNKYETATYLQRQGFDTPVQYLLSKHEWLSKKIPYMNFPLIVKPHDDGCSALVFQAQDEHALAETLACIFKEKEYALLEEKIVGMELTVGVLGNENPIVFPPSESIAKKGILSSEEKFLPGAGENQTPARLPEQAITYVQKVIQQCYTALHASGYARIDCFYQNAQQSTTGKERLVILEVNTLPALTPATCLFHQAAEIGIRPIELLEKIIDLGLEKHEKKQPVSVDVILEQQNLLQQKFSMK